MMMGRWGENGGEVGDGRLCRSIKGSRRRNLRSCFVQGVYGVSEHQLLDIHKTNDNVSAGVLILYVMSVV